MKSTRKLDITFHLDIKTQNQSILQFYQILHRTVPS
jgi:hypothetical protein